MYHRDKDNRSEKVCQGNKASFVSSLRESTVFRSWAKEQEIKSGPILFPSLCSLTKVSTVLKFEKFLRSVGTE